MSQLENYPIITALITPLTDQGKLDFKSLTNLIRLQEQAGNALVLLGSTGEGLALSLADKQALLQHVFSLQPKVPVIIGIGGFQLPEQLSFIKYCKTHYPVAGFLLVTPIYAKPGVKGQIAWFNALMDAADAPCILYNVPGRTAVPLHYAALEVLVKHPNFAGLKEASGDPNSLQQYQMRMPQHRLYSGNDECLAWQINQGVQGVISVAANSWPFETRRYFDACLRGSNTVRLDQVWEEASQALFMTSNPIPLKVLLYRAGKIASPTLLPPLTHEELNPTDITRLLALSQALCQEVSP